MAVFTVIAILFFQVYWVYSTYKTAEHNFTAAAANALQRSIDRYEVSRYELPATLQDSSPVLNLMMKEFYTDPMPAQINEKNEPKPGVLKFESINITERNMPAVRLMVARLLSQEGNLSLDFNLLNKTFTEELVKNNIPVAFKLVELKNNKQLPQGKIAAYTGLSKDNTAIEAIPQQLNRYLIKQNALPAAISLLLIVFSAGSLWYMWLFIRKQMQLDEIKNNFINNITHEFRTPISILKASNEALYQFGQITNPQKTERYLSINELTLNKLEKNIDRILDITQYEHGARSANYAWFNLDELVQEIIKTFSIHENCTIHYNYELPVQEIYTDGYIVETVFYNLIDNAIKYSGNKVDVHIKLSPYAKGWRLDFNDNGNGIKTEDLPFIFDKFYRVQSGNLHNTKGYGLGLSYVKQLVATLHGEISVKSKVNAGTNFIIEIPSHA
jgi:two-component system, OmpR family, phosphate regulon sensor histidine kinase PhoR